MHRDQVASYLADKSLDAIVDTLLTGEPWFFSENKTNYVEWSSRIQKTAKLNSDARLVLVGSGALGFSLAPTKIGSSFRHQGHQDGASDLDFCLIDQALFLEAWDCIVDSVMTYRLKADQELHKCVFWGRLDSWRMQGQMKARLRMVADTIRRSRECRQHKVSLRIYRREQDVRGYTLAGLRQTKRELGQ